ncbi:MAG: porin [Bacteroidota bacterium]
MPRIRRLVPTIVAMSLWSSASIAASELEQMQAALNDMQKLLRQQQARIEQLERQAGERGAAAPVMPATPSTAGAAIDAARAALAPEPGLATFYGRVDLFAEADWGGTQGSRAAIESGGMNGSRVGIKGGIEAMPETRLVYQLEAGFFANNGRLGQSSDGNARLFGRQAYLGVEGRLGRLTVGRQYSPYFMESIRYDAFENGYGSPTNDGNVKPGPTRYDNAVIYSTPNYRGLSGSTMLALGGKTGGSERNALALTLDYTEGPLGLGISYLHDNHNAVETQRSDYAFAGGGYQFDRLRLMGGVAGVNTSPDLGLPIEWRSWFIGSRVDVTSTGQLWLNYGKGRNRRAVIDDRGVVYSAAWMETINQQIKAYLAYARHLNSAGSALVPSGTSAYGYYSINPGDHANGLALGVQYVF